MRREESGSCYVCVMQCGSSCPADLTHRLHLVFMSLTQICDVVS